MRTTELRLAFSWTCEDCGRAHFVKPIPVTPELMAEVRQGSYLLEEDEALYQMAPETVTCPDCRVTFATLEA
jgi:hypothetical protein